MDNLLEYTPRGLYCHIADCYIDPRRKVERAIITHAHSDHAGRGHNHYLTHRLTAPILMHRIGKNISVQAVEYGEHITINGVKFSLHPAGHIIGSSQIRVEYKGEVWVVSGDYKLNNDSVADPYEPLRCKVFLTESTFGSPIYQWEDSATVINEINNWWKNNREQGITSVLMGYSLGKAQRLICSVDNTIGSVHAYTTIEAINQLYRNEGVAIPRVQQIDPENGIKKEDDALLVIPPSLKNKQWLYHYKPYSIGYASGWMAIKNDWRWNSIDKGFALSDHADWNELNEAVLLSNAERVYVTHGYVNKFTRHLRKNGIDARPIEALSKTGKYAQLELFQMIID